MTGLLPFVLLLTLLGGMCSLHGSVTGLRAFLTPRWTELAKIQVGTARQFKAITAAFIDNLTIQVGTARQRQLAISINNLTVQVGTARQRQLQPFSLIT